MSLETVWKRRHRKRFPWNPRGVCLVVYVRSEDLTVAETKGSQLRKLCSLNVDVRNRSFIHPPAIPAYKASPCTFCAIAFSTVWGSLKL